MPSSDKEGGKPNPQIRGVTQLLVRSPQRFGEGGILERRYLPPSSTFRGVIP